MATDNQQARALPSKRATYLTLIGGFSGLLGVAAAKSGPNGRRLELSPTDLAILGLATYRAGRVIAFDQVTEPVRAAVQGDLSASGAIDTKHSREESSGLVQGVRSAFTEMVTCPTCIGTWVGGGFVFGLQLAPAYTRAVMATFAASGVLEVLHYATNALDSVQKTNQATAELTRNKNRLEQNRADRAETGLPPDPAIEIDDKRGVIADI